MKTKADYLIYCDESCPLEGEEISLFGAISCDYASKDEIVNDLRQIKNKHFINSRYEAKWVKVSKSKESYFREIIDYFKSRKDISIRIVVATNKSKLDHSKYNNNDYQVWYYKMYYLLLNKFVEPNYDYFMMYDEKDKYTTYKMNEVKRILMEKTNYHGENIGLKIKQINSKESELMQVLDVIMGAVGYKNRKQDLKANPSSTKINLANYIEEKFEKSLVVKTPPYDMKLNIFIWEPRITNEDI